MTDDRPNVLLLLTDQERYDVTTPDSPTETEAMDRLAAEGMRFDRAFTPISICSSARASMLTGLYPHGHGMLNNCHGEDAIRENLPPGLATFGERLREVGYRNTHLGKWHVGRTQGPATFGFEYLGGSDRHHDELLESNFRDYQREVGVEPEAVELSETIHTGHADDPTLIAGKTPIPVEATRPYYLAERTIELLESWAEGETDRPQFHRTDFLGPHHPYVVPEPYASTYDPDDIDPWRSYAETFDGKPRVHERYVEYRGVEEFDWEAWAEVAAKYRGFVTLIDDQIGRILEAVEELGLGEELLTIHTSDHGDFVGNHRQFNKGPLMHDDTYRIPLFVRWPGVVEPGCRCEAFVGLQDLMPTLLDVGSAEIPEGIHGRSLHTLLAGERPDDWRDGYVAEYHGDEFGLYSQRMLRTGRYKYVYNVPDRDELYDLERDPDELANLIDHPEYEEVREELRGRLLDHMRATDDPIARWSRHVLGS